MAFCNLNWVNQGDSVREYKIEKGSLTEQHKPIINMDNIGKILNFSHNPFHFHLSNSFGFTAPKPPKWAFLLRHRVLLQISQIFTFVALMTGFSIILTYVATR